MAFGIALAITSHVKDRFGNLALGCPVLMAEDEHHGQFSAQGA